MAASLYREDLIEMARSAEGLQLGVRTEDATDQRLAAALTDWYWGKYRLHELLTECGWIPPQWSPYEGRNDDVTAITEHLEACLATGEAVVLFREVLQVHVSRPPRVKKSFINQQVQALIGDGRQEELYQILWSPEHPLAGQQ